MRPELESMPSIGDIEFAGVREFSVFIELEIDGGFDLHVGKYI